MLYRLKDRSFREIFKDAFRLYFDNFVPLFFISLAAQIPSIISDILKNWARYNYGNSQFDGNILFSILNFTAAVIAQGYIIHHISRRFLQHNGHHPDIMRGTSRYTKKLIALALLVTLISSAPLLLIMLTLPQMVLLLFTAFIIMIILYISLLFAPFILVTEKTTISETLKKCWKLIDGKRRQVFGMTILTALIPILLYLGVLFIASLMVNGNARQLQIIIKTGEFIFISRFLTTITAPISVCALILMYYNIRIETEDFTIEKLVKNVTNDWYD